MAELDRNYDTLGWVSLDENMEPYQPIIGTGYRARKKPITVYQTRDAAERYSPVGRAAYTQICLDDCFCYDLY